MNNMKILLDVDGTVSVTDYVNGELIYTIKSDNTLKGVTAALSNFISKSMIPKEIVDRFNSKDTRQSVAVFLECANKHVTKGVFDDVITVGGNIWINSMYVYLNKLDELLKTHDLSDDIELDIKVDISTPYKHDRPEQIKQHIWKNNSEIRLVLYHTDKNYPYGSSGKLNELIWSHISHTLKDFGYDHMGLYTTF